MERLFSGIPITVLSDSYKAGHFEQYPDVDELSAYGEFRCGYGGDKEDTRLIFYGIRYIVESFLSRQWTLEDVQQAEAFYKTHKAPTNSPYPWPKELFYAIVNECNGYFPIKLEALPEGSCILPHVPVFQITAKGKFARLVTFLETLLVQLWYPCTVATLSRRTKDVIVEAFKKSVDETNFFLIPSRLHDFGFRGCTCCEQSVIGGCAHLLNFEGSDTMSAAYYAQFVLNNGKPVASSIPATEHSVMMSWENERQAIEKMISMYGDGLFACVMDSYDYANALSQVLPAVAQKKIDRGGYMVLRPDSGDPVETVLVALESAEKVFGTTLNGKGYKVLNGCGVIQGDGIYIDALKRIVEAVMAKGFSIENVAFGMGSGLLQRLNRDVMSFATKLSNIKYKNGTERKVMKAPKDDKKKFSLPGVLAAKVVDGVPTVFPTSQVKEGNLLEVVYDHGPLAEKPWDTFDTVRERIETQWPVLPKSADAISGDLRALIHQINPHTKESHQ